MYFSTFRAYALKEYVLSTVCRTIFCKQWYSASTFDDELYDAQKRVLLNLISPGAVVQPLALEPTAADTSNV
jgi:hypothetical protein